MKPPPCFFSFWAASCLALKGFFPSSLVGSLLPQPMRPPPITVRTIPSKRLRIKHSPPLGLVIPSGDFPAVAGDQLKQRTRRGQSGRIGINGGGNEPG